MKKLNIHIQALKLHLFVLIKKLVSKELFLKNKILTPKYISIKRNLKNDFKKIISTIKKKKN